MKKLFIILVLCSLHIAEAIAQTTIKESVEPLLTCRWGQGNPFYIKCPSKTDSTTGEIKYCVVGCVACAMGQIMYYHKYPTQGKGTKSYSFIYDVSADFENTYYRWEDMLDRYIIGLYTEENADAVATLLYHCGVASGMIYTTSGSGAFTNFSGVTNSFTDYFRYDPESIKYLKRSDYTKEEWLQIIYENLSQGLPIFYTGNSPSLGGHAFVIDGYNTEGLVHINWGWKGIDDGYYDIDLTKSGTDFCNNQTMVVGIKPLLTDHIESIVNNDTFSEKQSSSGNGKTYNIMGQEVTNGKGLLIRNGKKIFIK